MKKITILFAFMLGLMAINAQNASDILRYSTRQPLGSARYVGVGGSMGAIGADFGACLLYTSPSPRDRTRSRMPSSA